MTICIAALCGNGSIFGATDRMLTAGDVEFEPDLPASAVAIPGTTDYPHTGSKMIFLTSSIVALTAGDSALQAELLQEVQAIIDRRIAEDRSLDSTRWWGVKEVAEVYRSAYQATLRARASHQILAPLSLDFNSFIARQGEMSSDFVKQITGELINFQMPSVAVIFAGADQSGSHIYVADNDSLDCHDSVGFATIGSGGWHAQTQFMLAGHDRKSAPVPETLFLTYLAKKRSEVAPGVGKGTDMFTAGPGLASAAPIVSRVVEKLEVIYQEHVKSEEQTFTKSRKETLRYVEEIRKSAEGNEGTQTPPKIDDRSTPADGSGIQVDPKKDE